MKSKSKKYPISFIGRYEITVLDDQRIILPSDVVRQLKNHGVKTLLASKLPGFNALVLCPEDLWSKWLNKIKRSFPSLKNHQGARSFLIPWQPLCWDCKGRVSLPRRARHYIGIKAHDTAILVGTCFYFELWREDEFNKITQECELTLRKAIQPPISIRNGVTLDP